MHKISSVMQTLKEQNRKALIPFIMAGDPSLAVTVPLMHALVEGGADMIELGMPFSDPMADGPVIQAADERALANGVTMKNIFGLVKAFRNTNTTTPIILMGYLNPIEHFGYEAFARDASDSGVDAVLIVDCPPEESDDIHACLVAKHIDMVFLATPTTTDERLDKITKLSLGYLYYVSVKGVTGSHALDYEDIQVHVAQIKAKTSLPIMVGFGISTPEQAQRVSAISDGVIIGSVVINQINAVANEDESIYGAARTLVSDMRDAIDTGERSSKC